MPISIQKIGVKIVRNLKEELRSQITPEMKVKINGLEKSIQAFFNTRYRGDFQRSYDLIADFEKEFPGNAAKSIGTFYKKKLKAYLDQISKGKASKTASTPSDFALNRRNLQKNK